MAWAQNQSCQNVSGPDSATDGDLDIAYALLLADRQWAINGAILAVFGMAAIWLSRRKPK